MHEHTRALAVFATGATLSLLFMEVVVRQRFVTTSAIEPGYGFVHEAGSVCRWREEGDGLSHWTYGGLRGKAPPDLSRPSIVAIGDSQTEALQVDDDEVYTAQLEQRLAERRANLQVLNAGRSSQSLADLILYAPRYKRLFHPRWTVVEVGEGDITDGAWLAGRAHFVRDGDELSVVAPPEVQPMALSLILGAKVTYLVRHCMLFQFGSEQLRRLQGAADPPWFRAGTVAEPAPVTVDDPLSYPVEDELRLLMATYDGRATILYLAPFDPKNASQPSPLEERLAHLCTAHGWSCVSARRYFPMVAAEHRAPYGFSNSAFNTGHLNALGHRILGQALDDELRLLAERGLL